MFNISLSKFSASDLRKYTKFIVVFVVIGFIAASYFFWVPKYREFKKNNAQLNVESGKVKLKKDYLFELETQINNLTEYQEVLSKINSALPMEYSPDALFSFVQKKASENGLVVTQAGFSKIPSASTGNVAQKGGVTVSKIDIAATVTGKYSSFRSFLESVYKNSRLIEVKGIKFEHGKEEEEKLDVFDFNLELEASYYNSQ